MDKEPEPTNVRQNPPTCKSIDWYSEGESRVVEIEGVRVMIHYIGRKGRQSRIAITAPAGAVFDSK